MLPFIIQQSDSTSSCNKIYLKASKTEFPAHFSNFNFGKDSNKLDDKHIVIMGHCITKYGLKAAINRFGDNAIKASIKEVEQLYVRNFFYPIHWHELIEEKRKSEIGSLIHIKEKQCGSLKG